MSTGTDLNIDDVALVVGVDSCPPQLHAELLTLGRIGDLNGEILTDCVKCGNGLILEREGRAGGFLSCTRFPQCR
ncbi:MAG: hypothetical protein EBS20_11105 [Actinobacteria bacterium]|nr:hypothetical protein [Actinomycetota bacterium]